MKYMLIVILAVLLSSCGASPEQIADACGGMAISHVRLVLRQLAADGWLCPMEPGGRAYVPVWVKNRIEGVENV